MELLHEFFVAAGRIVTKGHVPWPRLMEGRGNHGPSVVVHKIKSSFAGDDYPCRAEFHNIVIFIYIYVYTYIYILIIIRV